MKKIIITLIIVAIAGLVFYFAKAQKQAAIYNNPGIAYGNGRLEATEVNIATKLSGKVEKILVNEGDFVKKGQILAQMQTNVLNAELAQAEAMIKVREGDLAVAKSGVLQKESAYKNAKLRYDRAKELWEKNATSKQTYEDDQMTFESADAELSAAKAQVKQAEASIAAAQADAARIQADIDDSRLETPLDGRVQYRIAEPGEVLNAGGKVLNLVDLSDVYITFFLPEETAGKVKIGADVRIVLDALPNIPIPAKVSYVASTAQFTPKTVETQLERQKLMFRIKARIAPELLKKYEEWVKTGLPGVAWVKIDPAKEWPAHLQLKGADKK